MQKMNFYKDHSDTEAFEKLNSEEPKEWTSMEFQKGAQEYADGARKPVSGDECARGEHGAVAARARKRAQSIRQGVW